VAQLFFSLPRRLVRKFGPVVQAFVAASKNLRHVGDEVGKKILIPT